MSSRDSRATNNALETINAAANVIAIASADDRIPRRSTAVRKRRWWSRWRIYWCFGSPKQRKQIRHAALVPEPTSSATNDPAPGYPARPSVIALPFIAPPSSPASFLQSEQPSTTQSPIALVSLGPMPSMYSPSGRPSIFAIGPYAHEPQLVSPPVFSTYTTEPSTAPFTPPPESFNLTTPSSPEVPFAQLFNPSLQSDGVVQRFPGWQNYEFQFYQLPPGSPIGQLISPSSAVSGSGPASPFTGGENVPDSPRFTQFRIGKPPKLVIPDKFSNYGRGSTHDSGALTPDAAALTPGKTFILNHHIQESIPDSNLDIRSDSSGLNAEGTVRCVEKKFDTSFEVDSLRLKASNDMVDNHGCPIETSTKPNIGTDSGVSDKTVAQDDAVETNWSFFPVMHPAIR